MSLQKIVSYHTAFPEELLYVSFLDSRRVARSLLDNDS